MDAAARKTEGDLELHSAHHLPRRKAAAFALLLGIALGIGNHFLGLDFSLGLPLLAQAAAALAAVIFVHEGLHGAVGALLGHRPVFGVKPPLVFTTFDSKLPRGHFAAVALAPLILIDAVAAAFLLAGVAPLFFDLCFAMNTLGAAGDLWIAAVLLRAPAGSLVQDTRSGIELWRRPGAGA